MAISQMGMIPDDDLPDAIFQMAVEPFAAGEYADGGSEECGDGGSREGDEVCSQGEDRIDAIRPPSAGRASGHVANGEAAVTEGTGEAIESEEAESPAEEEEDVYSVIDGASMSGSMSSRRSSLGSQGLSCFGLAGEMSSHDT